MCFWGRKPPPPPRTPYKYPEALPEGYIRLLEYKGQVSKGHGFYSLLQPGKDVYEIVTVELRRAPAYTAVSYMWGNAERNRTILIDDAHILNITASANTCLNILSDQYLWVDSICINQDDNEEKARQVKFMGEIYHHVCNVVGVLAKEICEPALEAGTLLAFSSASEALSKLWNILDEASILSGNPKPFDGELSETWHLMSPEERYERSRSMWWEERLEFMAQYDITEDQMAEYEDYSYWILTENLRSHMRVVRILCHPYWRRVWIIQELAFAKNLTIYFDDQFLTWGQFMRMFDNQEGLENGFLRLERQNYLDPITRSPVRDAYLRGSRLLEMINETRGAPKRMLKDVLIDTMSSLATDPRDKIFGILNLVSDEPIAQTSTNGVTTNAKLAELDPWFSNPSIFPDYGKHKTQVLTEATMAMIIAGDVNTPLLVGGIGWDGRDSEVPSWVIDWSKPPWIYSNISPNARLDMLEKRFWAGMTNVNVGDIAFTPLDRKRVMGQFMVLDSIVFLSPPVTADKPKWLYDCLDELCEFLPEEYA
ncbi:heterokaryon incompatibility protein-domain-containing protein [Hypoxylon rubiginosum]|uniref:Heterokaryon incompatibility protein-domain-containing protein n=1 Tax=Hypoxylon rubiginosum TaxID=110542 RepID=A0ACC0CXT2_9PEZI|nr:heterokaryon incompatibility protein-domain-containing protein [Hypoxylon rubiginosum]